MEEPIKTPTPKDFEATAENIQPGIGEFSASHLEAWLSTREPLNRSVLNWLVRASRRLDGLAADSRFEILEGEVGNGAGSGPPHRGL